jgi:DNA-binding GntR family transcriptional regulator
LVNYAATAQQQAYIFLQDQIVSGVLAGGSRLHLETISSELGISRMPIREAIRQLDAEGYVTIRPNRGAVVTSRTPEQVVELFEIRAALEGLAMRLSMPHVTNDAIEDLKLELARLRRLESNAVVWVDRHDQFHDMICQLSHRPRLCADITRLRLAVKPYLRLYLKRHTAPEIKGYEHEYILEALQSGDGERAERVMREHVMVNAEAIAACLLVSREEPVRQRAAAAPKRNSKRQGRRRPRNSVAGRADRGR